MGVRSIRYSPEERIERLVGGTIDGGRVALKESCAGRAAERDGPACHFEPRALAKAENGRGVFFVKFADTFFASFVRRRCGGVGVDEMRIDLKWNEAERVQACRKNDGHIVCRFDCRAGQICPSAHA